jgi:hypothetical protein
LAAETTAGFFLSKSKAKILSLPGAKSRQTAREESTVKAAWSRARRNLRKKRPFQIRFRESALFLRGRLNGQAGEAKAGIPNDYSEHQLFANV